jgi:ABC-2 type transport system permease protein
MGDSFRQLVLVRLREFLREPEAVFWTFVFPVLLAGGLGIAFKQKPADKVVVGIHRSLAGPAATALRASAARGADAPIVLRELDDSGAVRALRAAELTLFVEAAPTGGVTYRYDAARLDARSARLLVDDIVQRGSGRRDTVGTRDALITEVGSRYIDFFIPGLLGMSLMGSGIWGIGFPIVTARSRKLLKRLAATPMSRAEFLLSFMASRLVFLLLEVVAILGFGLLVFGVPVRGHPGALALVVLLTAMAFSALGILVASRVQTIEGASGLMNFIMLPMWIFSGVFFSTKNFPELIQPVIRLLPLTAANDAMRAIMLQGTPVAALAPELTVLTGWTVVAFVTALRLFRWR